MIGHTRFYQHVGVESGPIHNGFRKLNDHRVSRWTRAISNDDEVWLLVLVEPDGIDWWVRDDDAVCVKVYFHKPSMKQQTQG